MVLDPVKGFLVRAWHLAQWRGRRWLITNPVTSARFVLLNREVTNFTYDIANVAELVGWVAAQTRRDPAEVRALADELQGDRALQEALEARLHDRSDRNGVAPYGRRTGWYCLVRLLKPRLVVETGTHDGLGTAVLGRALQRNAASGFPGRVVSFDVDPKAGWLVPDFLRDHVTLVRGWIDKTLPEFLAESGNPESPLDVFLHDSDHRYAHESWELVTVFPYLKEGGLLLSDNAHAGHALKDFATARRLPFSMWRERPVGIPIPGAAIGAAWNRNADR